MDNHSGNDVVLGAKFGEQIGIGGGIEVEDGEGISTGFVASEGHAGDVDSGAAHESSDVADDAWAVAIFENADHSFWFGFNVLAVNFDDPRSISEESARDGYPTGLPGGGKFDEFGEVADAGLAGFGDFEADGHCEGGSIDYIDFSAAGGAEEAREDGAGDRGGIDFVDFSAEVNV